MPTSRKKLMEDKRQEKGVPMQYLSEMESPKDSDEEDNPTEKPQSSSRARDSSPAHNTRSKTGRVQPDTPAPSPRRK